VKALDHFDSDGVTRIVAKTFPDTEAGATSAAKKLGSMNVGDEALVNLQLQLAQAGGSDGYTMFEWALDTATLSPPWGLSATRQASGGSWGGALGTKYYVVTAVNANGETGPSLEVSAQVQTNSDSIVLGWQSVPGATSYKVYRATTSNGYVSPSLIATVTAPGTGYTDTGGSPSAGAPPTENTTAGGAPNYGTPPTSFQTTPLAIGNLPVGKAFFYWARVVVPVSKTSAGNPRQALFKPVEA